MSYKDKKIIFFGTPEFSLNCLKDLIKKEFNIILVVTQADKQIGRHYVLTPPPVKKLALDNNLKILQNLNKLSDILNKEKPDLGIIVAYGEFLSDNILNSFKYGCINVHPSLLPKYRGASPIQSTILNGEKYTGTTIIRLDKEMDHGPIIGQKRIKINKNETADTLHDKLSLESSKLLLKVIPKYLKKNVNLKEQNHNLATYTKLLKREDGLIDWQMEAKIIDQKIRAFSLWPGTHFVTKLNNEEKIIKIYKALIGKNINSDVGRLVNKNGRLIVQTKNKSIILKKLQIEGKKIMTDQEIINGYFK